MNDVIRLAIFASGSGSNAENIVRYFSQREQIKVSMVFVNNPQAGVIQRMQHLNVPIFLFNRSMLYETNEVLMALKDNSIDFIVLAGFLWLVPSSIIDAYSNKILNIHPALLPKYGGKGMYGNKVHEQVIANKEVISGITIHEVNQVYDQGRILFQATCPVLASDTVESLANHIHSLEYYHFPLVIESWIRSFE